jgi:acyl-CoA thioesterase FadM
MEWTEAFFTEWLLALGHPISQMLSSGEATPVVRVEADYRAPIGVDDILEMRLSTAHLGDKSFSLWVRAHDIAGSAVLEVHVFHVYTLFEKSPLSPRPKTTSAPLPEWLRSALSVPIKS